MGVDDAIDINILTPRSMYAAEEFVDAVKTMREKLPDVVPERWGWYEPLSNRFSDENLSKLVPPTGRCNNVWWKRRRTPKAEGLFGVRWRSASELVRDTHGDITLRIGIDYDETRLVEYLKAASINLGADFGMMDSITEPYRDFAIASESGQYGESFFVTTHVLRHWLPDIFWGTVFGPAYVRFFGEEKLLSAPAFISEKIASETIYLQISPSIADLRRDFDGVQATRAKVKEHLGRRAFFDPALAYNRLEHGPVSKVFWVPDFVLNKDSSTPLH